LPDFSFGIIIKNANIKNAFDFYRAAKTTSALSPEADSLIYFKYISQKKESIILTPFPSFTV
jgi:hypothetical protein